MNANPSVAFSVRRASAYYPGGPLILRDVSLEVFDKELLGICGPNGSGKSTLIRMLTGWLPLSAGSVWLDGRPVNQWRRADFARRVAVVPQRAEPLFAFTVEETLAMALDPGDPGAVETILSAARDLELERLLARPIDQLSGGEWQRVLLARALVRRADRWLLDEPLSHLDLAHQISMLRLAKRQSRQGCSVLAVLHDLNLAASACDRVVLLRAGQLVAAGVPSEVLTEERLREVYGCQVDVRRHPESGRPWIDLQRALDGSMPT
jgi:iron complex transport system ATP-binding protein